MRRFFRRIPLIARVTIALALVAVVPLGYAVWSLFDVNRAGMHEQVLRTHAVAASTAAERISGFVQTRRALARAMAGNAEITNDPRSPVARQFLQELLAADPAIVLVELVDPSGEVVVRAQRRGAAEESDLASHLGVPGPVRIWQVGRASWMLIAEPLPEARGSLHLLSEGSTVDAALNPAEIGEHAEMILASGRDGLLAGTAPVTSFPPAMIETAMSSRVNGTGIHEDSSGREIMGAFSPVDGTNWYVMSKQPAQIAERIAGSMRKKAAIAAVVAAALALLLALTAQRTLVRPIREVITAQQVLAGNTPIPTESEIDQLRRSAELVQRRIADQEDLGRVFLGRYQVLGIIGQGGMGTVFRGWDPKLRRQVALKTIRFEEIAPEQTAEMINSLVAEAITAASMSHPNVVGVYDFEESPGAAFIAMELVEGVSLQSLILQRGAIKPEQAVIVGAAVARALETSHSRNLLHRDIKPANVLLGFEGAIKVTDFGLAALISTMASAQKTVFGTPGYIAPESATGAPSDTRSDLFALGVVLYECVTGENPFERSSSRDTMIATVNTSPPPLAAAASKSNSPLLAPLSSLVASLMEKTPDRRPSSATAVAERLENLAQEFMLQWKLEKMEAGVPLLTGRSSARLVPTIGLQRGSR